MYKQTLSSKRQAEPFVVHDRWRNINYLPESWHGMLRWLMLSSGSPWVDNSITTCSMPFGFKNVASAKELRNIDIWSYTDNRGIEQRFPEKQFYKFGPLWSLPIVFDAADRFPPRKHQRWTVITFHLIWDTMRTRILNLNIGRVEDRTIGQL